MTAPATPRRRDRVRHVAAILVLTALAAAGVGLAWLTAEACRQFYAESERLARGTAAGAWWVPVAWGAAAAFSVGVPLLCGRSVVRRLRRGPVGRPAADWRPRARFARRARGLVLLLASLPLTACCAFAVWILAGEWLAGRLALSPATLSRPQFWLLGGLLLLASTAAPLGALSGLKTLLVPPPDGPPPDGPPPDGPPPDGLAPAD